MEFVRARIVRSLVDLEGPDAELVLVLSPGLKPLFEASAAELFSEIQFEQTESLMILLPRQEPPALRRRDDGEAFSFLCTIAAFENFLKVRTSDRVETLCFQLLRAAMYGDIAVRNLSVRQLPYKRQPDLCSTLRTSGSLIMAHRGPSAYLAAALDSIEHAASSSQFRVRVGLDVESHDEYRAFVERYQRANFYAVEKAPLGPYVVRQWLAERSIGDVLVFHDSDDLSCYDRFTSQYAEMIKTGAHMVGCHELAVNEVTGTVRANRFPVDASAALSKMNILDPNYPEGEPLLHATAMIDRRRFLAAGGFSTDRKIANDSQFMLRAYFSVNMRNVDEFLYIRRIHKSALTVAAETKLGNPMRKSLSAAWEADFEAVKSGQARLQDTSLMPRSGLPPTLTHLTCVEDHRPHCTMKTLSHATGAYKPTTSEADTHIAHQVFRD